MTSSSSPAAAHPATLVYSALVLTAGTGLLLFSTWRTLSLGGGLGSSKEHGSHSPPTGNSASKSAPQPAARDTNAQGAPSPAGKPPSSSAVNVTYPVSLDMCDPEPEPEYPHATASAAHTAGHRRMFMRAGALMKLVDVVAGVAARRHAATQCVTVTVDAVLLLAPIPQDSLIHLSACVNRAWGSSMEVGVKVTKEDLSTGVRQYVSHSYLTFVAVGSNVRDSHGRQRQGPPSSQGAFARLFGLDASGDEERPVAPPKFILPPILPQTRLEKRRHMLAGRRRARRIESRQRGEETDGVSIDVKDRAKLEVAQMIGGGSRGEEDEPQDREEMRRREDVVRTLEMEFISKAWAAKDPAVSIVKASELMSRNASVSHDENPDAEYVEVRLPGDAPLRHPLRAVREAAVRLGLASAEAVTPIAAGGTGAAARDSYFLPLARSDTLSLEHHLGVETLGWSAPDDVDAGTPLASPSALSEPSIAHMMAKGASLDSSLRLAPTSRVRAQPSAPPRPAKPPLSPPPPPPSQQLELSTPLRCTMSRMLHLVFPEHCNSHDILFGGQTIAWMEECALVSASRASVVVLGGLEGSSSGVTVTRRKRAKGFSTVAIDGLEFKEPVKVGDTMIITSVVLRSFTQSVEVYVVAQAEGVDGARRVTNDALFTLACQSTGRESTEAAGRDKGRVGAQGGGAAGGEAEARILKAIELPQGTALESLAHKAPLRRAQRLEMKAMLSRLYG